MVLIAAREKPNIVKLTFLQLIVFRLNCSRSSSFVIFSDILSATQPSVSLKKPCSMPNGKKLNTY